MVKSVTDILKHPVLAVSTKSKVSYSFFKNKLKMDTSFYLFSYLLLIALCTNSSYIMWLKKHPVVFYFPKHLLRTRPIFARSSTLHIAGTVNTRQKMTVNINKLVASEFPNGSGRSARSLNSILSVLKKRGVFL